MLSILTYRTPKKFAETFKEFYTDLNIKQIKSISLLLLIITIITKIIGLIYFEQSIKIKGYQELTLLNYIEIIGSSIFLLSSVYALKAKKCSIQTKKNLTILFIFFILIISLSTSYIVSSYNTKNTLTMFLTGILGVSLFFVIEYKQIITTVILIGILFSLSMILPKISFEDRFLNTIIGLVLGFFLISLSRYNYYYKSQNFIKIKQLQEKNAEIEKLSNEKNDILNFVAHDLRNPLNNIEALSNLIIISENNSTEAEMIAASAKQAKEIINDLLDGVKSKINSSPSEKINLSENLVIIINKWFNCSKREIVFTDNSKECLVKINPSKLERVMDNLISNGLKFSENHQPIEITLTSTAKEARIKIEDFGIGIPKELQKNIFDQFSQSGRAGLSGEKSTGLGLHISKKIIEEHQGQLLMNSEEQKGTTFEIILSLA